MRELYRAVGARFREHVWVKCVCVRDEAVTPGWVSSDLIEHAALPDEGRGVSDGLRWVHSFHRRVRTHTIPTLTL